jgi:hypothetical protein
MVAWANFWERDNLSLQDPAKRLDGLGSGQIAYLEYPASGDADSESLPLFLNSPHGSTLSTCFDRDGVGSSGSFNICAVIGSGVAHLRLIFAGNFEESALLRFRGPIVIKCRTTTADRALFMAIGM